MDLDFRASEGSGHAPNKRANKLFYSIGIFFVHQYTVYFNKLKRRRSPDIVPLDLAMWALETLAGSFV